MLDLTTLTTLLAGQAPDGDHAWWPLWPLLWIAVIGTIVWLVVRRRRPGGRRPGDGTDRARDILAERYARGEINWKPQTQPPQLNACTACSSPAIRAAPIGNSNPRTSPSRTRPRSCAGVRRAP